MGKIGDLWIKLGLKKDEFSRGMKEAGNEISGSGGLLGKLKNLKVGAIAVWAAIGAAAVAAANKFAHTSQRFGDIWDQTMAGMKGAWNTFIAAINSADFSNLGKRLANSFREARQLAGLKDAEFEVMNSIELQKAAMKDELAVLRIRMQNQKLSQKEREEAAKEYLAKVKTIYDQEAAYRKKYSVQAQNTYLTSAGVKETSRNREALQTFLTNVAPDAEMVKALDEYNKNNYHYANESQRALLEGLKQQTGVNLATLGKIANYYQSTNDQTAKALVDAIVAEKAAAGAFDEETRRVQTLGNNVVTGGGGGGGSHIDAMKAQAESILKRAQDAAKSEIQLLSEKYSKEKALLVAYGLDTTALWEEYCKSIKEIIDTELDDFDFDIELDPPELDDTEFQATIDDLMAGLEKAQAFAEELGQTIAGGLSDAIQELADQFAGLQEMNPGRVLQALLTPLADMAIKAGEIIMAEGVATIAARSALETFGETGWGAVAAGAALVAAGAAAKAGLAALARSNGGSPTTTYSSGGTTGSNNLQTIQTEMTVYVTGRISGSDILLSGKKTQDNYNR